MLLKVSKTFCSQEAYPRKKQNKTKQTNKTAKLFCTKSKATYMLKPSSACSRSFFLTVHVNFSGTEVYFYDEMHVLGFSEPVQIASIPRIKNKLKALYEARDIEGEFFFFICDQSPTFFVENHLLGMSGLRRWYWGVKVGREKYPPPQKKKITKTKQKRKTINFCCHSGLGVSEPCEFKTRLIQCCISLHIFFQGKSKFTFRKLRIRFS